MRALAAAGFEQPGSVLQLFAERLLATADASPVTPVADLVVSVLEEMDEDPARIVAAEPKLRAMWQTVPADNVADASRAVLLEVAQTLVRPPAAG